jgi:outer membrane cobalamin receptor
MRARVSFIQSLACVALLLSTAVAAWAQSAPPASRSRATDALLLEDIPSVFGASRFDQLSTEAPASVSVLTREDIAAHGWRTLAEVLQTVRGLYVINDGLYATLGTRAFGRPGDYNTRMLLVIDGHRINENIYDSGMIGFESPMHVDDIERIEVIRGPASSLYGTSAFFGVVNVVTARGRASGGVRARATVESFGTRDLYAAAGERYANGLEVRASFNRRRSDGRDYFFPELTGTTAGGWARGLDGEHRDRGAIRVDWGEFSLTGILNLRDKNLATARYGVDFGVPGITFTDNVGVLGATYNHAITPSDGLRLTASYNTYDYDGTYFYEGAPSSDFTRGRWAVVEAQYTASRWARHRIVLGTQLIHNFRQAQLYREAGTITFESDEREGAMAAYVQDEYRFAPGWILNSGLRVDRYQTFGTAVNPRLGLIKSLRPGSAVKLLYGKAFRAPNVFERLYEGTDLIPNPDLRPERISTVEFLAEHQLSARWKLTAAAFHNRVRGLVDYVDVDGDEVGQYQNTGAARAQGLELEAEYEWRGTRTRASHVLQRAVDDATEVDLSNAPRHLTTADVTLPVSRGVTGSVEVRAVSDRVAASGVRVAGYTTANLWLSARIPRLGARVSGGVFNALNRQYADPAGGDFVQSAVPQAGRHFRLNVELGSR